MAAAVIAMLMSSKTLAKGEQDQKAKKLAQLTRFAEAVLGKNGGDKLFYFPTKDQPHTPKKYGYGYEDVYFKSADGTLLHGWFMPSISGSRKAKGTIVFSHGNTGSIAYHLSFVDWLIVSQYNVLLYDYRGFGKSEGKITRKGLIEDVQAALAYVSRRKDIDPSRLVSFAHSLGGAKSIVAIGMKPVKGLRAMIVHGAFASYRDMARDKVGSVGGDLTTDDFSAIDFVDQIAPVPLLVIHGEKDRTVPVSQGIKLYDKAKQPKTLYRVAEGSHTDSLRRNDHEYRRKILRWLDDILN